MTIHKPSRQIVATISGELDRQARTGAKRIDINALASAIEGVVGEPRSPRVPPEVQMRQARRPEELNATNDG